MDKPNLIISILCTIAAIILTFIVVVNGCHDEEKHPTKDQHLERAWE